MMHIYVGNLSHAAVENDLRRAFQVHGRVTSVAILRDPRTGRFSGSLVMPDDRQARQALRAVPRLPLRGRHVSVRVRETQADFGDCAR